MAAKRSKAKVKRGELALLVGTAKGGFMFVAGQGRRSWRQAGPFQFGAKVNDFACDPRDGKTLLLSATGGHLGPTILRSTTRGRRWTEAVKPPAFGRTKGKPKRATGSKGQAVSINLFLAPGHAAEAGVWYVGTSPWGLFRSTDAGSTWRGVRGFNDAPTWWDWTEGGKGETPDGGFLHSIRIDPRDAKHMYVSLSIGGTFETHDRGRSWTPLNAGVAMDFAPPGDYAYGHDPHCMITHPADPDRLYQQNHCGLYRLDRAQGETWTRIGRKLPRRIGDIGFPVVPHPTDPDTIWTFPMDGTSAWPRTSPGGKPAVYRTQDGGRRFERLDAGLPPEQAWFTVLRQAMTTDHEPRKTGVYFGTTSGEVWASRDRGESWARIAEHLPRIYSLRAVVLL